MYLKDFFYILKDFAYYILRIFLTFKILSYCVSKAFFSRYVS